MRAGPFISVNGSFSFISITLNLRRKNDNDERAMTKKRVLVAMSGGVDSSLSAALLLERGYEVIGGFMKNWDDCDWREDRRDALRVAAKLGIPLLTFNFEKEYRKCVVEYMIREYAAGRTPNPDVMCNKFVKFDLFVREADKLSCDFVATGHYANIGGWELGVRSWDTPIQNSSPQPQIPALISGTDPNKDQSYFLCQIPCRVLSRVIFPVGHMLKSQVREEARTRGLPVADKPDSQGVCFIGEINITEFLKERIPETPGNIVSAGTSPGDVPALVLGRHRGLAFYTIGQREGLKIGGLEMPYYVAEKRVATNELVVSSNFHQVLYRTELTASNMNWLVPISNFQYPISCLARIRYRQPLERCVVNISHPSEFSTVRVTFDRPQRAVTPGQFIVFYDGEIVLGGGVIVIE